MKLNDAVEKEGPLLDEALGFFSGAAIGLALAILYRAAIKPLVIDKFLSWLGSKITQKDDKSKRTIDSIQRKLRDSYAEKRKFELPDYAIKMLGRASALEEDPDFLIKSFICCSIH